MGPKNKKRGFNKGEDSARGGWEIVYTSFVLILLCFFVMLSSFSTMEEAKVMRFVKSFVSAVSILPGGLKLESGGSVVPDSPDIVDSKSKLARVFAELKVLTGRLELDNDVAISFSTEGLVMRLSDYALFDVGVADISPKAIPLLKRIGAIVAKTPYEVRIEGHTDDLPIKTARFPSNWELSTTRAVNVLRYFIETNRIPCERLSAVGFGEFQPVAPNDSEAHRAKNRRVEIIFLEPDK